MVHICQECHSLRSAPKRRCMAHLELFPHGTPRKPSRELHKIHGPPGTVHSPSSQSPEWFGPGKGTKCTAHLGSVPLWGTWEPKWLRRHKCKITRPNWDSALAEHTGTWAVWTWEVICCLGLWQTQCGPFTVSTPHTCQWYLFAVSLHPHGTTEQVSLDTWTPSPPCVRLDIRHWIDLQTKEAKMNKEGGTTLEVIYATEAMLRVCKWGATIDLENKYKPEKGTIWHWTDPTLSTTAPEKFLDIVYYYHFKFF